MTISQLLRKISKLKGEVKVQRERASSSTVYNEKEPPAFAFADSLAAADAAVGELIRLEAVLRKTNANTTVTRLSNDVISLSEATCRLQELKSRIAWLSTLTVQSQATRLVDSVEYDSVSRQPYKAVTTYICTFTEVQRAAALKEAQEAFDGLNDLVETANHQTVVEL